MVSQIKMPKFSGKEVDFPDFSREWQQYVRIVCPEGVASVGDPILLEMLKLAVDNVTRQQLISALEANPGWGYREICKTLEEDFTRDLTWLHQKEWKELTLGGFQEISSQKWRQFMADFELKARRVGDITEREMVEKIKQELPSDIRYKLGEENLRVSSTRFWVKIPQPLPVPVDHLQTLVARLLGRKEVCFEQVGPAYLFDCGNKEILKPSARWTAGVIAIIFCACIHTRKA